MLVGTQSQGWILLHPWLCVLFLLGLFSRDTCDRLFLVRYVQLAQDKISTDRSAQNNIVVVYLSTKTERTPMTACRLRRLGVPFLVENFSENVEKYISLVEVSRYLSGVFSLFAVFE